MPQPGASVRTSVGCAMPTSLLTPAQSAYYRGGIPHRWWSAGGGAYRLLVVKQGPRLVPSGR
jgi:hypothetical protein